MDEKPLLDGTRIVFNRKSGNDRLDPTIHAIESREIHNGLIFYRLIGLTGSLFLRSSLETAERMHL